MEEGLNLCSVALAYFGNSLFLTLACLGYWQILLISPSIRLDTVRPLMGVLIVACI